MFGTSGFAERVGRREDAERAGPHGCPFRAAATRTGVRTSRRPGRADDGRVLACIKDGCSCGTCAISGQILFSQSFYDVLDKKKQTGNFLESTGGGSCVLAAARPAPAAPLPTRSHPVLAVCQRHGSHAAMMQRAGAIRRATIRCV